ncbi:MAG TPA: response regulator [Azospirillaceae bacterium]|nr:response regulator [Azospirillaceae bacterium]
MGAILIVEDQLLIGMELRDMLEDQGFRVLGPVGRLSDATGLSRSEEILAAVLDYDLHGEPVLPLALELRERGIPFLILSAFPRETILAGPLRNVPHLEKPADPEPTIELLRTIIQRPVKSSV